MHTTAALLQDADRLHRQGALAEAASRYWQVLAREPNHPRAIPPSGAGVPTGWLVAGIDLVRRTVALPSFERWHSSGIGCRRGT